MFYAHSMVYATVYTNPSKGLKSKKLLALIHDWHYIQHNPLQRGTSEISPFVTIVIKTKVLCIWIYDIYTDQNSQYNPLHNACSWYWKNAIDEWVDLGWVTFEDFDYNQ